VLNTKSPQSQTAKSDSGQVTKKREVKDSKQMFKVLPVSSHTNVQPSMPLVDCLDNNTSVAPDQTMPQGGTASGHPRQVSVCSIHVRATCSRLCNTPDSGRDRSVATGLGQ